MLFLPLGVLTLSLARSSATHGDAAAPAPAVAVVDETPHAPLSPSFASARFVVTDGTLFLLLYFVASFYFAAIMIRLLLTLAPVACIVAADGISALTRRFAAYLRFSRRSVARDDGSGGGKMVIRPVLIPVSLLGLLGVGATLLFNLTHAEFMGREGYSSPSITIRESPTVTARRPVRGAPDHAAGHRVAPGDNA